VSQFASALIAWQKHHGRKGLPWQGTRDPYRIWLSEVMLQQTQVAAVIPYYERFLKKYPDVKALAAASEDEVLQLWSGLGYYARGRNLHLASQKVVFELGGKFPDTSEKLGQLPGIGRSTAAAIAAFAFGERAAILDGNVKRVLARCYGVTGEKELWQLAERLLPKSGIKVYTQALMDLGATVCVRKKPRCEACPVRGRCVARQQDRIAQLPAPRARKVLPLRKATWLVLLKEGEILLEKRPSLGIWGGLWSFPEASGGDAISFCMRNLGCKVEMTRKLQPVEHAFTHFRLRIQPLLCTVRSATPRAEAPGRLWLEVAEAAAAAVPAPVRTLLARLPGAR
jgi:A/G-specific adenine glycosylase